MGRRVYPSIPHLPRSRCAADRTLPLGLARRCIDPGSAEPRSEVIVQEKLDGSCVAVVRREGALLALGRDGRPCAVSGNEARRWFADWVASHAARFVTLRAFGLGRANAEARFQALLDAIARLGLPIRNKVREYTVFDSNPAIDRGWIEAP